jgi:hypothetical protein
MRIVNTRSRGTFHKRKLPHWQPDGAAFFLTWRLRDSLPKSALKRIEQTRELLAREIDKPDEAVSDRKIRHFKKLFALADDLLDRAQEGPTMAQTPTGCIDG